MILELGGNKFRVGVLAPLERGGPHFASSSLTIQGPVGTSWSLSCCSLGLADDRLEASNITGSAHSLS